jgi:hypothetical protein
MSVKEVDVARQIGIKRLVDQNRKQLAEASTCEDDQEAMVIGYSPWQDPSIGQEHPVNYTNLKALLRIIPELTAAILKKVDLSLGSSDVVPYLLLSDNESHKNEVWEWLDKINVEQIFRTSFFQLYFYGDLFWNMIEDKESFEVVSADTMKVNTDPYGNPESYVQVVDGNPKSPLIFFPCDIIHTKLFDLGSEIYGFTQSESLLIPMIRLLKMENYNAAFLNNNATPRGAWRMSGISRIEKNKLVKDLTKIKPHQDMVTYTPSPDGKIDYSRIGLTMEEMSFKEGLDYQQMKIVKGTGVPNIVLGDPEGSNRATALTQYLFTMIPINATQRLVSDMFNTYIIPSFFGYNDVKLVFPTPDMRTKSEKATDVMKTVTALGKGAKELGIIGMDGSPLIPELLQPLQIKLFEILDIEHDFSKSNSSKSLESLTGASGLPNDEGILSTHLHQKQGSESENVKRQPKRFTALVEKLARELSSKLVSNYNSLKPQIVKILDKNSKAIAKNKFNKIVKQISVLIDSQDDSSIKETNKTIKETYDEIQEVAADRANQRPGTKFDKTSIKFLEQARFHEIKGVSDEVKKKIGFELAQGVRKGESTSQIAKRLGNAVELGKTRMKLVAKAAVSEAMLEAEYNEYEDADINLLDILLSGKETTCELCIAQAAGGPYTIAEVRRMLPAHPGCLCDAVPA